jgi:hypothetical protein
MRILALGVTAWDVIAYCGGTLALSSAAGDTVTIAALTPATPAAMQAAEAAAAAVGSELTLACVGGLDDVRLARDKVMDMIRAANPDVIISSSPSSRRAAERQAARLIFNAAYGACVPNYASPRALPAVAVRAPIVHMDSVALSEEDGLTYVDIGPTWPRKLDALAPFAAADGLPPGARHAPELGEVLSRARGVQVQTMWAEAFGQAQVWGRLATRRLVPQ